MLVTWIALSAAKSKKSSLNANKLLTQLVRSISILFIFGCTNTTPRPICDVIPSQDENSLEFKYGFQVYHDLLIAQECSANTGRPIFLMFSNYASNSTPEDQWKVLADKEVKEILEDNFVFTILYKDDREKLTSIDTTKKTQSGEVVKTVGEKNSGLQIGLFQSNALCYYRCLNAKLEPVSIPFYCLQPDDKDILLIELRKVMQ